MLFINDDPVDVRVRTADRDDKGRLLRGGKGALHAKFKRGVAPGWARRIGVDVFEMKNCPVEVPREDWLAAYDSEAEDCTPEERRLIEARLVELGYMAVEPEKIKPPYPMYDEQRKLHGQRKVKHAIEDIQATYALAGFNVEHAVAYERQEGNHPEVIAALEALNAPSEGDEAEQVIAA